jgi:hypothetical protein
MNKGGSGEYVCGPNGGKQNTTRETGMERRDYEESESET